MSTATATAPSGRVLDVTIGETGIVRTSLNVLLGDVDAMTRLGWEFATPTPERIES